MKTQSPQRGLDAKSAKPSRSLRCPLFAFFALEKNTHSALRTPHSALFHFSTFPLFHLSIQDVVAGRERRVSLGEGYDGRKLSISHAIIRDHISKHIGEAERDKRNIPLTADDFEFLPIMWRKPSRVLEGKGNSDVLELETLDDAYLYAVVDRDGIGIRTFYKTRHRREPGPDTRDAAGQQPAGPAVE